MVDNIFPFDDLISRTEREHFLKQHAKVLWFTGLSGAGKTTIARTMAKVLFDLGYFVQILDGDNIRSGINNNLDFTEEGRRENIRRIAEVSKLFVQAGIITINSFITPTPEYRKIAKDIIGHEDLIDVFIHAPLEVCEKRDVKGLYKKARKGLIKNFTGIDSPFIEPENPTITLHTHQFSIEECVRQALEHVLPIIRFSK